MPMDWVMDPSREPMIAVQMNGVPLPRAHGYPARLIVPGLFGYVSATKWLTELELTTWEAFDAYWVPLGWAKKGPILTQSRIDTPRRVGRRQGACRSPASPGRPIAASARSRSGSTARGREAKISSPDLEGDLGAVAVPTGTPTPGQHEHLGARHRRGRRAPGGDPVPPGPRRRAGLAHGLGQRRLEASRTTADRTD